MSRRTMEEDLLRRKRELRLRIARSRRQIDRRLRGARDETRQLASWRTYVVRYPVWALTAALGAGLAASAGLSRHRTSRWLGFSLVRHAMGGVRRQFCSELLRLWTDATPDRQTRE